jgi:hypothetical protein
MTILEILNALNIPNQTEGHEHCRPGWVQTDCPWCSKGWGHYRLGINLSGGYCNCWACGPQHLGKSLAELAGVHPGKVSSFTRTFTRARLPGELAVAGKLVVPFKPGPLLGAHRRYLERRKFDPNKVARIWEVQGIGPDPRYGGRLYIPIRYRGEVVSWTTRSISDTHATRYRSASRDQEKINHKHLLYGIDYCRNAIVVVEGPTDVWRIGPGAVCTFGDGCTRKQLVTIASFPIRVIWFDSEPEAVKRAKALASQLEVLPGETYVVYGDSKDPGTASPAEIKEIRQRFLSDVSPLGSPSPVGV